MSTRKRRLQLIENDEDFNSSPPRKKRRFNVTSKQHSGSPVKRSGRFTHFISIRICSPFLIELGKSIQHKMVKEYQNNKVSIQSSLIKHAKFHVSLNILSLSNQHLITRFCNGLSIFSKWLRLNIFDEDIDINISNKSSSVIAHHDKDIFLNMITKYDYTKRFKNIYKEIIGNKSICDDGLPFYVEGVNHFRQSVIFLDFEKKCQIPLKSKDIKQTANKSTKNTLTLKLLKLIYELIRNLCDAYKIKCDKKKLIPHCTLMKLSKIKHHEMNQLKNYNKRNGNDSNYEKDKYDTNTLSVALNIDNFRTTLQSIKGKKYENITDIDLCAMQGISSDGYYKIVHSISIVPT